MDHTHIVKRHGHEEAYDNHKVYASCYAACVSAACHKEDAERICGEVMQEVDTFIDDKGSVTSDEIFNETARAMRGRHGEAAFLYETHRDIS
ncbi:MAG: hypothetical protein HY455_01810 [Parcubacteria group bacterium]|nr:hypothetical protein [Parcubacteria group bacterium]